MFHNPNPPRESSDDTTAEFQALEHELRNALRPVDPPAGFADRVLARARQSDSQAAAQAEPAGKAARAPVLTFTSRRSRVWIGSAIAAMLLAGVAVEGTHRMEQRRRTEEAQRQFETAMQVTNRTLDHVRDQLQRVRVPLDQ
jgi:hypothetical protein